MPLTRRPFGQPGHGFRDVALPDIVKGINLAPMIISDAELQAQKIPAGDGVAAPDPRPWFTTNWNPERNVQAWGHLARNGVAADGFFRDTNSSVVRLWADWPSILDGPDALHDGGATLRALDSNIAAAKAAGLTIVLVSKRFPAYTRTEKPADVKRFPGVAGDGTPDLSQVRAGSHWYAWTRFLAHRYHPDPAVRARGAQLVPSAPPPPGPTCFVDVLEVVNEPNNGGECAPQRATNSVSAPIVSAQYTAEMLRSAKAIGDEVNGGATTPLFLAGPATSDQWFSAAQDAKRDVTKSTSYDEFYLALGTLLRGWNPGRTFILSHHAYQDTEWHIGVDALTKPTRVRVPPKAIPSVAAARATSTTMSVAWVARFMRDGRGTGFTWAGWSGVAPAPGQDWTGDGSAATAAMIVTEAGSRIAEPTGTAVITKARNRVEQALLLELVHRRLRTLNGGAPLQTVRSRLIGDATGLANSVAVLMQFLTWKDNPSADASGKIFLSHLVESVDSTWVGSQTRRDEPTPEQYAQLEHPAYRVWKGLGR